MALALNGPKKNCGICNTIFQVSSKRNKYCSQSCAKQAKAIQHLTHSREWSKNNAEYIRKSSKRYYEKVGKAKQLRIKYGIDEDYLYQLHVQQNKKCKICSSDIEITTIEVQKRAVLDHDHNSLRLRGLLCTKCNKGLGLFNDSKMLLRLAAEYIEQYEQ